MLIAGTTKSMEKKSDSGLSPAPPDAYSSVWSKAWNSCKPRVVFGAGDEWFERAIKGAFRLLRRIVQLE